MDDYSAADIRSTALFHEVSEHFRKVHEPAFGTISGALDPVPSPDGSRIAFTGTLMQRLEGVAGSRVCVVGTAGGTVETVTAGPNDDRAPEWSPDGTGIAFLSDRAERGVFQLYLLEAGRIGEARPAPPVDGTIEYLAWSPDGRRILLGVAGRGADMAGGQGSGTTRAVDADAPAWTPVVDAGTTESQWRRLWVHDVGSGRCEVLTREGLNVWEAAWAGPDAVAAIVSEGPGEDLWYEAPLALVDAATGDERVVYRSSVQLGVPCGSPSGERLAVVEALCSDRWIVAGDVLLVDPATGSSTRIDTLATDVTHLAWRDDATLQYAGVRGFETVLGTIDPAGRSASETWTTRETCGARYPSAVPLSQGGAVTVVESYRRPQAIAVVGDGAERVVHAFDHPGTDHLLSVAGRIQEVTWDAPDGLEIQGLLVLPDGDGPFPLIVNVHGGPVWAYRNKWTMYYAVTPILVSHGYAVLHPNPRGSSGRGQKFAEMVLGDMGGADTDDYLSGIDALVRRGIADPQRIGVTGGSYGGFMSSWLITQDRRFAAAVPVAPCTNFYSQHNTSNIGFFDRLFLKADPFAPGGRYHERSPVMFAANARTPTLNIAGALDRCTPPTQAVEFHQALLEHGVTSELVIYPQEGHGIRQFPAVIDYCARVVAWFERFMPAS